MVRKGTLVLGLALAALWGFGLLANRQAFILWFDLVAAIAAVGISILDSGDELGASRGAGPAALGVGLGVIWLVGLGSQQPRWAVWANFVAACASLSLGIAAASQGRKEAHARP